MSSIYDPAPHEPRPATLENHVPPGPPALRALTARDARARPAMPGRLFGTDGVRGLAGEFLTADLALALGREGTARVAAAHGARGATRVPRVLVIRDTRESGEMLESAVCAGVATAGGVAVVGGVLPTPAAPLLVRGHALDLGIVISASHNPYTDNGIKFFGSDGYKLSDAMELEIERALESPPSRTGRRGGVEHLHGALDDYVGALEQRFSSLDLSGRRIVLDCANGATYRVAPEIFRRLGATVDVLAADPDGRNINDRCGSTYIERAARAVAGGPYDLGFAFDGDGDRALAVDRTGAVVDGDELIALAALHLRSLGDLPGDGVVVTVMTNFGFHVAMRAAGLNVVATPVGDRYVLEELRRRGWALGGEQSGHIIDMRFVPSGDGIAAALLTMEALGPGDLAERAAMEKLPQKLVNVPIRDDWALGTANGLDAAVDRETVALSGRGRVLLRVSGTEPVVRVMVEAPSVEEAEAVCERLVAAVEAEVG